MSIQKNSKKNINEFISILKREFPQVKTPLHYKEAHELAIAVILSAQCTDEQVNKITPSLFKRFPNLSDLAEANIDEIEKYIYSSGFYKNKAKNIKAFCQILLEKHQSILPNTIEELIKLPGVGRKTANVILQEIYDINQGVVVDTHVLRISKVWKLTESQNPERVEKDLMAILPKEAWRDWSLRLIFLGRKYCGARKQLCKICPAQKICPSVQLN